MTALRFLALLSPLILAACQEEWHHERRDRCSRDPNPYAYKCEDYR